MDNKKKFQYEDIVNLPHHESLYRRRMPIGDRAAQFSPFAALTGHDDAIRETERRTEKRIDLDEDQKIRLDEKFCEIKARIDQRPCVTLTCFKEDALKEGGSYEDVTVIVRGIDFCSRALLTEEGFFVPIDDVYDIKFMNGEGDFECSENC